MHTPTTSSPLRAASKRPDIANASIANASTTTRISATEIKESFNMAWLGAPGPCLQAGQRGELARQRSQMRCVRLDAVNVNKPSTHPRRRAWLIVYTLFEKPQRRLEHVFHCTRGDAEHRSKARGRIERKLGAVQPDHRRRFESLICQPSSTTSTISMSARGIRTTTRSTASRHWRSSTPSRFASVPNTTHRPGSACVPAYASISASTSCSGTPKPTIAEIRLMKRSIAFRQSLPRSGSRAAPTTRRRRTRPAAPRTQRRCSASQDRPPSPRRRPARPM